MNLALCVGASIRSFYNCWFRFTEPMTSSLWSLNVCSTALFVRAIEQQNLNNFRLVFFLFFDVCQRSEVNFKYCAGLKTTNKCLPHSKFRVCRRWISTFANNSLMYGEFINMWPCRLWINCLMSAIYLSKQRSPVMWARWNRHFR